MQERLGVKEIDYAEHRSIRLNDADYVYLEAGEGPLLVLLHGYPDDAYSWEHQIRFFSSQAYHVVAPFLRGYAPTAVDANAFFDLATIVNDIVSLIQQLNPGKKTYLVGQDWGAAISYSLLGAYPDIIDRAMILAVPHPVEVRRTLKRSPKQVIRAFHWFLFQLPYLPEFIIRRSKGKFLKYLWSIWSPNFNDEIHVQHIVDTMLQGQGVEHSLAYYRALLQSAYRDPDLTEVYARLTNPISTPTRVLCGEHDMRGEMLERQRDLFDPSASYKWGIINNAGHFLHREQPDAVNKEILNWLSL